MEDESKVVDSTPMGDPADVDKVESETTEDESTASEENTSEETDSSGREGKEESSKKAVKEEKYVPLQEHVQERKRRQELERQLQTTQQRLDAIERGSGQGQQQQPNLDPQVMSQLEQSAPYLDAVMSKQKYVKADQVVQVVQYMLDQERRINSLAGRYQDLSKTYSGEDGMPKFDPEEIVEYQQSMAQQGLRLDDPEAAYKHKYAKEYEDSIRKSALRSNKGTYSERPSGRPTTMRSGDLKDDYLKALKGGSLDTRNYIKKKFWGK